MNVPDYIRLQEERHAKASFIEAVWAIVVVLFAIVLVAILLCGCSTGAVVEQDVPGSALPSSTVGYLHHIYAADGKTIVGDAFTAEGHDTYNWLLSQHGQDLRPPRTKDFGVTLNGSEYDLTEEAVIDWGRMATWSRSAEHEHKTILQKVGL